ncbi:hypothetical protein R6Q59_015730 [Mikania micrantha]
MAYAASSIQKSFKYDVFLSFRGEDTRKTFVDHLHHALDQKSIIVYKDDVKIKKGKRIGDELIASIEDSKFYIIVFSKGYASSSWCLEELVKIMECQKMSEHTAYPVFYDVEPTQVRKQIGAVGDAIAKHKAEDTVKWREALREAANLAGWELSHICDGHEAKLIQKIVEEISLELRFVNYSVDAKLVGMETRVKDVVSSLESGVNDVCLIGIKGMGGSGKTTLARAVFDQISFHFEGKSFVENVREVSKDSKFGLKQLQKQVLRDVLNDQSIGVTSLYNGKNMMEKMMRSRKVLIVLDDVDLIDQLEALAGETGWFKPGSKIIITTRDKQVLEAHQVNFIHDINLFTHEEAICLFSRYAFGKEIPNQGYEKLSEKVVRYADGLPLTIRVLGSLLCGKAKSEWVDTLERLKTIPLKQTLEMLELSYIGLEEDHKEIFLDVACILRRELKDEAIKILECCGFHAQIGLKFLEQKCLITVSKNDRLCLHDHIEEMGRNIVRRLHPTQPNKHSRLWIQKEIEDILVNELGTEATKCIKLQHTDLHPTTIMKGLMKMKELRFLYMSNRQVQDDILRTEWKFDEASQYLPNSLRFLRWHYYPFWCLPKSFEANNLVNLEMCFSNITQLWEGGDNKVLNNLRFLNLSSSKLRTFDFRQTPHLEKLDLGGCKEFIELHMPIECPKIKSIDLHLSKLCNINLGLTPNLKRLNLEGCKSFVGLHMPSKCPNLISLDLSYSKLRTFDLRMTPHLERLHLGGCKNFIKLYMPVECPNLKLLDLHWTRLSSLNLGLTPNLERLDIRACNDFEELRIDIQCTKLKSLDARWSKLSKFNLGLTPHIERLDLGGCNNFVELLMPVQCPNLKKLDLRWSKLCSFNLGLTPNLERLDLKACNDFVELHIPFKCPKLRFLNVAYSKLRTFDVGLTPQLERLDLRGCNDFVELHMPVECPNLKVLDLRWSKLGKLKLGMAPNLERLDLKACIDFVELHIPMKFQKLRFLNVAYSKLRTFDVGLTPQLERLDLRGCNEFVELHMPIECPNLKVLDLRWSKLGKLNLGPTPHLERLDLEACNDLVKLHIPTKCPKLRFLNVAYSKLRNFDVGLTPQLERLDLRGCNDFVELHMPVECPSLKLIDLRWSKLGKLNLGLTPHLERLDLEGCNDLVELLHIPIKCPKLRFINVSYSKLRSFDVSLTPQLEMLDLRGCNDFVKLHMHVECPKLKVLDLRCSKVGNLNLGLTPNLERLDLGECNDFIELHMDVECPKLKILNLANSKLRFFDLGLTPHLESLDLGGCNNLIELHTPVECPMLKFLHLSGTKLSNLNLGLMPHLEKFTLEGNISKVPNELYQLNCLRELTFLLKEIKHLPESICMLKHLKSLELKSCLLLEKLPDDLGQLECLEKLILIECVHIRDIPNNICKIKCLKYLHLRHCIRVEKLPEELGRLECLIELNIEGTSISHLPQSISQLKGLCIIGST